MSRTTHSVRLTEAGNRFREKLSQPMADVKSAFESVAGDARPSRLLRIAGHIDCGALSVWPADRVFRKPIQVTIDVTVTDDMFHIVAAGLDAGVRLGEVIEQDKVAVPLTKEEREVVVATPGYFQVYGNAPPSRELAHHRCIGWRPSPSAAPYRWEFAEDGIPFDVAVEPPITTNDLHLMIRIALAGGGTTFASLYARTWSMSARSLGAILRRLGK